MNLWNRSRDLRLKFFSWMHIIREDFNFFVVWSFFFLACKFFSHFFHSHRLWEMFEIFDYEILTIIKTIFTSIELVINSGNVLFKTIKKDMVCTYIFVKKKLWLNSFCKSYKKYLFVQRKSLMHTFTKRNKDKKVWIQAFE